MALGRIVVGALYALVGRARGWRGRVCVTALLVVVGVVASPSFSAAVTDVSGTISADTTWDLAGSPYVVTSTVTVASGVTLTVSGGAVVKFFRRFGPDAPGSLAVQGSLRADASGGPPIVFTSLYDDTAGGDTNGDGSATTPAPGDWGTISFYPTSTNNLLRNVVIRYGGDTWASSWTSMLAVLTSSLTLQDSTVAASSSKGLFIYDASPTITGSRIQEHQSEGVLVQMGGGTHAHRERLHREPGSGHPALS